MRHVDTKLFFRWFAASVLLLTLFVAGCGTKASPAPEAEFQARSSNVAEPEQLTPGGEGSSAMEPETAPQTASPPPPVEAPFDDAAALDELEKLNEAERPRSLFRSIGRALQKGVTDATAGSSNDAVNDPANDAVNDPVNDPAEPE